MVLEETIIIKIMKEIVGIVVCLSGILWFMVVAIDQLSVFNWHGILYLALSMLVMGIGLMIIG